jgi:hypothetical protein
MPAVQSSAVDWVRHDPESDTLDIRYKGGDAYRYFGVPAAVYRDMMAAPSLGAFVNAHIKPVYRCTHEPGRRRFRPD